MGVSPQITRPSFTIITHRKLSVVVKNAFIKKAKTIYKVLTSLMTVWSNNIKPGQMLVIAQKAMGLLLPSNREIGCPRNARLGLAGIIIVKQPIKRLRKRREDIDFCMKRRTGNRNQKFNILGLRSTAYFRINQVITVGNHPSRLKSIETPT